MPTPNTAPMELDFDVCQALGCESFDFRETTGQYSFSNSGGWGSPNFEITDATGATVVVTLPDGTQSTHSVTPFFPDDTGILIHTFTNSALGLSGSLPDGIYTIKYIVDILDGLGAIQTFTKTKTFLFSCTVKCCIDKLTAKIPTLDCKCNDKNVKNALLTHALYLSLIHAGKCGNTAAVTSLLNRLTKICNSKNCGCS